jgi:hypothetical protein
MVRKNGHARSDDSDARRSRNWWGGKLRMRRGCAAKRHLSLASPHAGHCRSPQHHLLWQSNSMGMGSDAAENNGLLARHEARGSGYLGSNERLFQSGSDRTPSIKKRWMLEEWY